MPINLLLYIPQSVVANSNCWGRRLQPKGLGWLFWLAHQSPGPSTTVPSHQYLHSFDSPFQSLANLQQVYGVWSLRAGQMGRILPNEFRTESQKPQIL